MLHFIRTFMSANYADNLFRHMQYYKNNAVNKLWKKFPCGTEFVQAQDLHLLFPRQTACQFRKKSDEWVRPFWTALARDKFSRRHLRWLHFMSHCVLHKVSAHLCAWTESNCHTQLRRLVPYPLGHRRFVLVTYAVSPRIDLRSKLRGETPHSL